MRIEQVAPPQIGGFDHSPGVNRGLSRLWACPCASRYELQAIEGYRTATGERPQIMKGPNDGCVFQCRCHDVDVPLGRVKIVDADNIRAKRIQPRSDLPCPGILSHTSRHGTAVKGPESARPSPRWLNRDGLVRTFWVDPAVSPIHHRDLMSGMPKSAGKARRRHTRSTDGSAIGDHRDP
jgi:hypothetical protein